MEAARSQRLEGDARRAQILAAAKRLYAEHPPSTVSSTAIAREAGVARGLLHHYFGTQRELYLEVVRSMVHVPPPPPAEDVAGRTGEALAAEVIDGWLTAISRNRATWMASHGVGGATGDPEVDTILRAAREEAVDRLVAIFGRGAPLRRPALRAYSAYAEAATLEWLRRRLTRTQLHGLLTSTLLHLIDTTEEEAA